MDTSVSNVLAQGGPGQSCPDSPPPASQGTGDCATSVAETPSRRVPWVTLAAGAVMVALFAIASLTPGRVPFAGLGYRGDAVQVWSGAVWVLVASAFIHLALWHLALNVCWLWILGRVIERTFGPLVLGLLLLTSALVSSALQLAVFDNVGTGASGIVYALFGFGWLARGKSAALRATVTPKVAWLFVTWLLMCWILWTRSVGNGAHLGGLLFGAVAAEAVVTGRWPRLARAATALLLVLALTVGFVCPWSATWWSMLGYRIHAAGQTAAALEAYGKSLQLRPDQPWVMANMIRAYRAEGKTAEAAALLAKLKTISPADAARFAEEPRE